MSAYDALAPEKSRKERISDLENEIESLIINRRHYQTLLDANGERTRNTIRDWRETAKRLTERAENLEREQQAATDKLATTDKRIAECRQQIAAIRSEREVLELQSIMEQLTALDNPKLREIAAQLVAEMEGR